MEPAALKTCPGDRGGDYTELSKHDPSEEVARPDGQQEIVVEDPWEVFVNGDLFQGIVACVIIINAAIIGLETDLPEWHSLWQIIDDIILLIFTGEIVLRMVVFRQKFFTGKTYLWNNFDLIIVTLGVLDFIVDNVLPSIASTLDNYNVFIKMLRLLRLVRLVRLIRMFKQLYMLATGLLESLQAIFWVTMLCGLFLFTCAIVLTQGIGHGSTSMSEEANGFCKKKFGSVTTSMMTLFDVMASPDFGLLSSVFISDPLILLFFVFFIIFGSFTMISILTGVISEGMMEKSQNRKEELRFIEERKKKEFVDVLTRFFQESDQDGDGTIARDEFESSLPMMTKMFLEHDFSYTAADLAVVFDLIDFDGGGTIGLEEFLDGVASFTANISDLPMHMMRLQCNMYQTIGATEKNLTSQMSGMEDKVNANMQTMASRVEALDSPGLVAKLDRLYAGG
jgi:voltage-gated sodium channel